MHKTRGGQSGLGLFGLIFTLILVGFFALILMKAVPIYINQMTISKNLHDIAGKYSTTGGEVDVPEIITAVQRRWDADYINQLKWSDIRITRGEHGLAMSYDYEARADLFDFGSKGGDIILVIHFADNIPIRTGG